MNAKEVLQFLLNKPDTSVNEDQPRDGGDEFLWLGIKHAPSGKYLSSICINDDGTASFILPAPWTADQDPGSRLAYDLLREVYRAMRLTREGDGIVYRARPTPKALDRGYLLAKNFTNVLYGHSFEGVANQLERIAREPNQADHDILGISEAQLRQSITNMVLKSAQDSQREFQKTGHLKPLRHSIDYGLAVLTMHPGHSQAMGILADSIPEYLRRGGSKGNEQYRAHLTGIHSRLASGQPG